MMRRYSDAICTSTNIPLYVQRTKTMLEDKQNDQISIDESLHHSEGEEVCIYEINKMQDEN